MYRVKAREIALKMVEFQNTYDPYGKLEDDASMAITIYDGLLRDPKGSLSGILEVIDDINKYDDGNDKDDLLESAHEIADEIRKFMHSGNRVFSADELDKEFRINVYKIPFYASSCKRNNNEIVVTVRTATSKSGHYIVAQPDGFILCDALCMNDFYSVDFRDLYK